MPSSRSPPSIMLFLKSTLKKQEVFQVCYPRSWSRRASFVAHSSKPDHFNISSDLTFFNPYILSHSRLCPEDLNSSVLTYMTDTLGFSLADITYTLTNNRPSAIMACYHLLLNKLSRSLKGTKAKKVLASHNQSFPSTENNKTHSNTTIFWLLPLRISFKMFKFAEGREQ